MTTRTRPLPAHGTTARAYGSPGRRPRCQPCRTARNRHQKQIRVNRELGRSPFTNPAKAQAHLQKLHQSMSWDTLAAATGVQYSNLIAIYHGTRTKIRHETEAKILAVTAPAKGDPGQYIDVTITTRQVQALSYVGHSYSVLAAAANSSPNRIASIANGSQPSIRRNLANRIAAIYSQLAFSPPPRNKHTSRTRNLALAKGWHGPLAWPDINDPKCQPEVEQAAEAELGRNELAALRRTEIEHLDGFNLSSHEIAARLGISESTVNGVLRELHTGTRRNRHPQTETELAA